MLSHESDRPPTGAELQEIMRDAAERAKPVVRQMKGLSAKFAEIAQRPDPHDPRSDAFRETRRSTDD